MTANNCRRTFANTVSACVHVQHVTVKDMLRGESQKHSLNLHYLPQV